MKKSERLYNTVLNLDQINKLSELGLEIPMDTLWSWQKELQTWAGNANDQSDYSLVLTDEIPIGSITKYHRIPTLTNDELLSILPPVIQTSGIDYYLEIYPNMVDEYTVRYMKGVCGQPLLVKSGKRLLDVFYEVIIVLLKNNYL